MKISVLADCKNRMNIPIIIIIKITLMLCQGGREHGTPSNDTSLVVEENKILDTYIAYGLFSQTKLCKSKALET